MAKRIFYATIRVEIENPYVKEITNVDVDDFVAECDYLITSNTRGITVTDTEWLTTDTII